jgi:hypothetical protein
VQTNTHLQTVSWQRSTTVRRWPNSDLATIRAIAEAVERAGGDYSDVEDLCDVWDRVARRNGERADRIRAEATRMAERFGEAR